MKKECNLWKKAVLCTSLFFISIFYMLLPSDDAKAYYYADTEQIGGWAGYRNDDGTYTITGCTSIDQYDDNVLRIPATFNGKPVTAVNGDCKVEGCHSEFCDHNRTFDILFPLSIKQLVFPDSVTDLTIDFKEFINLEKVCLPNNDTFGWFTDEYAVEFPTTYPDSELEKHDLYPKLKEIYMRHNVIDSNTQSIEKIHFYDGATIVSGGNYPNLTEIELPDTIREFLWTDSPKLTNLICAKELSEFNILSLAGCKNLHITVPVHCDAASASDSLYKHSAVGDFSNSGITELIFKGSKYVTYPNYDRKTLQELRVIDDGSSDTCYTEGGALYHRSYTGISLDSFLPAKSTAADYIVSSDIVGFGSNVFDSCRFTSITLPEDLNPNFKWTFFESGGPFDGTNCKIRVIKGSAACNYTNNTKEELARMMQLEDTSRIEFYTGNTYTITYNLNGGTNAPNNPTSYRAGEDPIALNDPVYDGYTFLGWKRNDISNGYENTTARRADGYFQNYTFTAVWQNVTPQTQLQLQFVGTELKNISGGDYKVTGNAEVEYTRPSKANDKNVTIPNTIQANGTTYKVTSIAPNAFRNNKKLTNVKIGSNVATIGANAFSSCKKLKKVSLSSGLTLIDTKAFYKCTSLTKISIPKSVERIGKQAFGSCMKLKSIIIKSTVLTTKSVGSKAFSKIYKKVTVKVPKQSIKAYKKLLRKKGLPSSAKIKK